MHFLIEGTNMFTDKAVLPTPEQALKGRAQRLWSLRPHVVNGRALEGPYDANWQIADFGLGCFWGAERRFWQQEGVMVTAVGYAGGYTPHPTYREVCSGMTGHAEVVRVVFDPARISFAQLLKLFWEAHDPTQGMRQGNDRGTQYRSVIYGHGEAQLQQAQASAVTYGQALRSAGFGALTTEIRLAPAFWFAEDEHQQYLAKHPDGYCGLRGTGVSCA